MFHIEIVIFSEINTLYYEKLMYKEETKMEEEKTIEGLMQEVIINELEALNDMEVGTDEYRITVDGLTKLVDKAIEMDKFQNEFFEKVENRKKEDELKERQMKEDKKNRLISHILTGVGIAVPAILTVWGTCKSLKFEEEGTVTTAIGRGFINKLLPRK